MATGSEFVLPTGGIAVPFPVRKFSVSEYQQMVERGILAEDEPVELLEGWITPKMTKNPPHDVCVDLVNEAVSKLLPAAWRIRIQSAIETEDSQPEPDVTVVAGPARRWIARHPGKGEIALVVEVADTSLLRDRNKVRIYASAAVPNYWIVNLVERQLEVYAHPTVTGGEPGYETCVVFKPGDSIEVSIDDQVLGTIAVTDVLP